MRIVYMKQTNKQTDAPPPPKNPSKPNSKTKKKIGRHKTAKLGKREYTDDKLYLFCILAHDFWSNVPCARVFSAFSHWKKKNHTF